MPRKDQVPEVSSSLVTKTFSHSLPERRSVLRRQVAIALPCGVVNEMLQTNFFCCVAVRGTRTRGAVDIINGRDGRQRRAH